MKHIISIQREDGTFPEVGSTPERFCLTGISRARAVATAHQLARQRQRRVRVESWASADFYRAGSQPITAILGDEG